MPIRHGRKKRELVLAIPAKGMEQSSHSSLVGFQGHAGHLKTVDSFYKVNPTLAM